MKSNSKFILLGFSGFLVLLLAALLSMFWDEQGTRLTKSSSALRDHAGGNSEAGWAGRDQTRKTATEPTSLGQEKALRAAMLEKDPRCREELLRLWAFAVPLDAMSKTMEQIDLISDSQLQPDARFALASRWAVLDPKGAAAQLLQYAQPSPGTQNGNLEWIKLLDVVLSQWIKLDTQQAMGWIQSMPDGEAKSDALGQANYQIKRVVDKLAASDPQAAAAYAANLPAGDAQNQAMEQLLGTWAGSDAAQAGKWLQGLPESPSRDFAVNAFSRTLGTTAPDAAFQWAETITDEAMRNRQLQNVANAWLVKDPSAAKQAVSQSNLPQEIKSRLLATARQ